MVALAYVGLAAFTVGVLLLIGAVGLQTSASRITLDELLNTSWKSIQIRAFFERNTYMLGGQSTLDDFRDRLNTLQTMPHPLEPPEREELKRLLAARETVLATGANEKARLTTWDVVIMLAVGALLAAGGAATFALSTNHDVVIRTDNLARDQRDRAKVTTGELLPKTPSSVTLVVPAASQKALATALGTDCKLTKVNVIALEIGARPDNALPTAETQGIVHVVSERTDACKVAELWVPPDWIVARSAAPSDNAKPETDSTTSKQTETQPASPAGG